MRRCGRRSRQELVERLEGSYRFIHDRVQEAAYSLIPEALRAEAHLRIGRLLAAQTPPEKREEAIFEIVNQLNRGAALITHAEEREQLAELNLIAGKRAKASTAYASALTYLNAGAALLAEDCWERRHELGLCAGAEPGRMRIFDRPGVGRRGAIGGAVKSRRDNGRTGHRRVLAYGCLSRPSIRATARSLFVSTTSGMSASSGHRIRQRRRCDANTSASGRCSGAGRSRSSIDLPLMERPGIPRDRRCSELRSSPPAMLYGCELGCPDDLQAVSLSLEHGNCDASCSHT